MLGAYPLNLAVPDPFSIELEKLVDMGPIPPILSDFTTALAVGDVRGSLDQYLFNRGSSSFVSSLKESLLLPQHSNGSSLEHYNLPLMNALVMYVGVSSVAQAKARSGSSLFIATDPGVVLLHRLASDLDVEGENFAFQDIKHFI